MGCYGHTEKEEHTGEGPIGGMIMCSRYENKEVIQPCLITIE